MSKDAREILEEIAADMAAKIGTPPDEIKKFSDEELYNFITA